MENVGGMMNDEKPKEVEPEIPNERYIIKHTLVNRKERRRREKEYKVKYDKRNKSYIRN